MLIAKLNSSKVKLEMNIPGYSLLVCEFGVSAFISRTFFFKGPDILNNFDIVMRCRRKGNFAFFFKGRCRNVLGLSFFPQDGCVGRCGHKVGGLLHFKLGGWAFEMCASVIA